MADVGKTDFGCADLNGADFRGANLKGANFNGALLDGANLRNADLNGGDLRTAKLVRVDLSRAALKVANLAGVDLRGSDLRGADLSGANLKGSSLMSASLHEADLRNADLTGVNLTGANLTDTRLKGADLTGARVGGTVFADVDLRHVKGLDTLRHMSPSTIGTDTLARSRGTLPETFLRGCGLSLAEIQAERDRGRPPRRALISHSQQDDPFVEELRRRFAERGIQSWVATHELKGTLRERQSKLAIQHDVSLILVLSHTSVQSDWAEHELRLARRLEKDLGEPVLCPISLDEAWKMPVWKLVDQFPNENVLSFADWRDAAAMGSQFDRLLESMAV
jgi:hypothetical protein